MGTLTAGEVTVSDDGAASFDPADPNDSLAGRGYVAEVAFLDLFTTDNGGTVPPDADRVPLLRYHAGRWTALAATLVPFINAQTGDP